MRSIGLPELIVILVVVVLFWLPWSRIFSKAGYSPWLALNRACMQHAAPC